MKHLYIRLLTFFNTIKSKIAFYPTLLSVLGIIWAFTMVSLEGNGISKRLMEVAPSLLLEDGDTALTIMSVCIGGLISMMVFSFSMVMLLLSQASSNFSPRLLPGLISDKRHQIILGTYLATILYNIFTLFAIEPDDEKYSLPGLSILLGIILTILCLCLFIYFIHNISQSIQINNILDDIFDKSRRRLSEAIEKEDKKDESLLESFPNTSNWHSYTTIKSGYFQNISFKNILGICKELDTRLYFMVPKGLFVLQHAPFIKSEKELDEESVKRILSNINFSRGELVEDNYILAFKQITEIIVKAMSPGINDPGTAINAIDYLTELLALRMKKRDSGVLVHEEKAYIKMAVVTFEELLYNVMASIRTYCKHDPILVQKLLWMLYYLKSESVCREVYKECIENELALLLKVSQQALDTEEDIEAIKAYSNRF
ncbi:MAG: DUF2254 domain-containing protein [Flavobacteriales bacterium]|jgi:uncharacterized membrane protein|uniref:DUF2254 domain-containing protein n=1 Tax=Candidatus Ulvibacter alkanivorans TaxID=2267620 RepID=UPI000DF31B55|nr:DUF2254 domain-containing protein [Candidatus Ulvibacter alkanivorans]MCH2490952.1 DUF2254 domain-containing protein [Flavobacteriales bacterium]